EVSAHERHPFASRTRCSATAVHRRSGIAHTTEFRTIPGQQRTIPLRSMLRRARETRKRTTMIIDSHAHLVPPDLLAGIRKSKDRFPSLTVIEDGASLAFAFAGGKPTRPVSKPLSDIAARLAWMNQQAIDAQVVGGWVDMFGYELPAAEGDAWSRLINEALLAAAKAEPRFI